MNKKRTAEFKALKERYAKEDGYLRSLQVSVGEQRKRVNDIKNQMDEYEQEDYWDKKKAAANNKTSKHDFLIGWVPENLKAGTRVKFSGCRDRHGLRTVRELKPLSRYKKTDSITIVAEKPGYITEHMVDKLNAVLIDGEWKKVKELMNV